MGYGGVLPFEKLGDFGFYGLGFIFLLFFAGALYTLVYSMVLVGKNKKKFVLSFKKIFMKYKKIWYFSIGAVELMIIIMSFLFDFSYYLLLSLFTLVLLPLLYFYVKAVEQSCMVCLVPPNNLIEGDWLEQDVKVGKKWIRKSIHGLSLEEINILRKAKNKVLIKKGVPFAISFLMALVLFFYLWFKGLGVLI